MRQLDHQATLSQHRPRHGDTLLTRWRYRFYLALLSSSLLLLILCCVRFIHSAHPPTSDLSLHEPFVAELLFTALLILIWVPFLMYAARYSVEHVFLTRVLFEYVMLAVLWLLQTGGAAAGLSTWHHWYSARLYRAELEALVGTSWLGWTSLSALCGVTIYTLFTGPRSRMMDWRTEHVFRSTDWRSRSSEACEPGVHEDIHC